MVWCRVLRVVNPGRHTYLLHSISRTLYRTVQYEYSNPTRPDPCTHHPSNHHTHRPKPSTCPSKPRNEPACVKHPNSIPLGIENMSRPLTEKRYISSLSLAHPGFTTAAAARPTVQRQVRAARLFYLLFLVRGDEKVYELNSSRICRFQALRERYDNVVAVRSSPHPTQRNPPHR